LNSVKTADARALSAVAKLSCYDVYLKSVLHWRLVLVMLEQLMMMMMMMLMMMTMSLV